MEENKGQIMMLKGGGAGADVEERRRKMMRTTATMKKKKIQKLLFYSLSTQCEGSLSKLIFKFIVANWFSDDSVTAIVPKIILNRNQ